MRIKYILTIISFALLSNTSAQTNLSLSDAIQTALQNNYSIRIIEKSLEISDLNNSWGKSGLYPTIDVTASSLNRLDHTELNETTTHSLAPSAQLNWTLFNGLTLFYNKSQLETIYRQSAGNASIIVENTIQAIINSYYKVLLEQEKLKVYEFIANLSKDKYDKALIAKDLGTFVTYDVLQTKNSWLFDHANYLKQKLAVNNSVRQLNLLMGSKSEISYLFTEKFEADSKTFIYDSLERKMLSSNKTLKNQFINEIYYEREIKIAKSAFYPTLRVSSGIDYLDARRSVNNLPATTAKSYDYYANLTLSLNLFNGFNSHNTVEIAKIQNDIAKIETTEMKQTLTNTLAQMLELYNVQKELLTSAETNLETANLNLRISEEKFQNGVINSFNYRDIQVIFLNASLNRLNAIYNLINTNTELARLTGSIITEN